MASIINASTSGVGGVITTADNSGDLNIQSGGSTKIAVTSAGANIIGTLTVNGAAPAYGKVLQVVNATYASIVTNSTSTFASTGLSATITPSSATSKILVFVNMVGVGKSTNNTSVSLRLYRSGSSILGFEGFGGYTASTAASNIGACSTTYLDSPATTSATTYSVYFKSNSNNDLAAVQNYSSTQADATSTITLMEIAA